MRSAGAAPPPHRTPAYPRVCVWGALPSGPSQDLVSWSGVLAPPSPEVRRAFPVASLPTLVSSGAWEAVGREKVPISR